MKALIVFLLTGFLISAVTDRQKVDKSVGFVSKLDWSVKKLGEVIP